MRVKFWSLDDHNLTLRGVRLLRFTDRDVTERAATVAAQVRTALVAAQP